MHLGGTFRNRLFRRFRPRGLQQAHLHPRAPKHSFHAREAPVLLHIAARRDKHGALSADRRKPFDTLPAKINIPWYGKPRHDVRPPASPNFTV